MSYFTVSCGLSATTSQRVLQHHRAVGLVDWCCQSYGLRTAATWYEEQNNEKYGCVQMAIETEEFAYKNCLLKWGKNGKRGIKISL